MRMIARTSRHRRASRNIWPTVLVAGGGTLCSLAAAAMAAPHSYLLASAAALLGGLASLAAGLVTLSATRPGPAPRHQAPRTRPNVEDAP